MSTPAELAAHTAALQGLLTQIGSIKVAFQATQPMPPPPGAQPPQGPPPGADPSQGGGPPPGADPSQGAPPPGADPSQGGQPPMGPEQIMQILQQVVDGMEQFQQRLGALEQAQQQIMGALGQGNDPAAQPQGGPPPQAQGPAPAGM